MRTGRIIRSFLGYVIFILGVCFHGLVLTVFVNLLYLKYWPRQIHVDPYASIPHPSFVHGRLTLPYTDQHAVAQVASYNDELQAFLRFQFLCSRMSSQGVRVLLTATPGQTGLLYRIFVVGQDDLLTDISRLGQLQGRRLIAHAEMIVWSDNELALYEKQSHLFEVADELPVEQTLETLDVSELQGALADFLMFKSETDIRVLEDIDPKPQPLTHEQAEQSAADILAVARFYDLPLDYFLGVGAMENDYMDVNGDLKHAVWKVRALRDDIVLRRGRKSVLVSDYSMGAWQITRETLRAAHRLYLRDKHDYSLLPEHLRPSRDLDLNTVNAAVLTTYAGLLLRELLDHYHGNVPEAIAAYNGGTATPNLRYAFEVAGIAEYARRILQHASVLHAPDPTKATATAPLTPPDPDETVDDLPLRVPHPPKL
jgi:hypothetical protein